MWGHFLQSKFCNLPKLWNNNSYQIDPADIEGRLFVDTGREQQLILANQIRDDVQIDRRLIDDLKLQLTSNEIDVLIVDPFVSSHRVNEMDNGKIDYVTKEWVRRGIISNKIDRWVVRWIRLSIKP